MQHEEILKAIEKCRLERCAENGAGQSLYMEFWAINRRESSEYLQFCHRG